MSDHSEEKAGDLFAIALYLDHRCRAHEIQLNSKLHGISNLLILASIFLAFYYPKTFFFFFKALLPQRRKTSMRVPNQPFVKQNGLNRSPFFPKHSWGPSAPQDRCSPAKAVPRNVLAGTMPAHSGSTAACVIRVICCG